MKIRKLQLKNIGVFDDETIEFQPCPTKDKAEIHIFTGQNGSGKTTILQALVTLFCNSVLAQLQNSNLGAFEIEKNLFSKKFHRFSESVFKFEVEHLNHHRKYEFQVSFLGDFGRHISPFEYDFENIVDKSLRNYSVYANNEKWSDILNHDSENRFDFASFAYSGYRKIKDVPIEIGNEIEENPLFQALEFVKDDKSRFTINQWLGQNLINSSLAKTKGKSEEAKIFDDKVGNLVKVINDIIAEELEGNKLSLKCRAQLGLF